MKWFKREEKCKEKCKHFKAAGKPYPPNMFEVVRFSPYKTDMAGYRISECSECGKRAFACIGLHMMGEKVCKTIDGFIGYRITIEDLTAMLKKEMAWYEFKSTHRNI